MDITSVRLGLETNLATVSGLRVSHVWPDSVNPPAALVTYGGPEFLRRNTLDRTHEANFDVVLVVSLAGNRENAQDALDAYLDTSGSGSVIAALEANNAAWDFAHVLWVNVPTLMEINGVTGFLGATLRVQVIG